MVATLHDIVARTAEIGAKDNGTLADRVIKVTEEAGEIAAGYGLLSGYKRNKKKLGLNQIHDNIKEECVDTIICALDILVRDYKMQAEAINALLGTKFDQWEEIVKEKQSLINQ
jgi:hypothetical protein